MGIAHDLLRQAKHLATYEGENPSQASLRRAVSTAYYALFHLLTGEAASRWTGSAAERSGLERGFEHRVMASVSRQFNNPTWKDWHNDENPVPLALQSIARAFVRLQEERNAADYDNHESWTAVEAQEVLNIAGSAFENWTVISADPMAGNYLMALLLPKRR